MLLDLLESVSKIVYCAETEKSAREMGFVAGRGPGQCPAGPAPPCPWPEVATACVDEQAGFASREYKPWSSWPLFWKSSLTTVIQTESPQH